MALEEDRQEIKGKIFCLLDTDKQYEKYISKTSIKQIAIKRLHNCTAKNETTLKSTNDNKFFPPTEIEDCLDAKKFIETFSFFSNALENVEFKELSKKMKVHIANSPSGLSLNLGHIEQTQLESFFDTAGMKTNFSKKYCELDTVKNVPNWINQIKEFLANK
ncbi:hypothetical protein ACTG2E_14495 [Aeromonas veronii]